MADVLEARLENGLKVVIQPSHHAPVVSTWIWYRVGSRHERTGTTGISHWVEHMLFKGTEQMAKGDVFRLVARQGGHNNAFTAEDFTCYFETLPASAWELALDIEADRMVNARFDPDEVESERTVILAERQGSENSPQFQLGEELAAAAFRVHPYRWPVIGTTCDLRAIRRDDLYSHYRTYYAPNNAVLVIAGDVEPEAALSAAKARFEPLPPGPEPPPVTAEEPPQYGERRVTVRRPGSVPYLQVGFHIPAASHPDIYPLFLLDAILSGGKSVSWSGGGYMGRSARLYRALVRSELATSVGSGVRAGLDPNLFSLWLTARPGVALERIEAALFGELAKLAEAPPTAEEVARARRQAEAQFAYGRDGVTSQAFGLGYFEHLGDWRHRDRHLERLGAVTPADVSRVAATYLTEQHRVLGWFIPAEPAARANTDQHGDTETRRRMTSEGVMREGVKGQMEALHSADEHPLTLSPSHPLTPSSLSVSPCLRVDSNPIPASKRFAPQREVLPNGVVLLLNENRDSPSVAFRASLRAGGAEEEQAGLASFVARMLRRGAGGQSADAISEAVEAVGASFSIWAGSEEAALSAKCLGGDLEPVLDLLRACLEAPDFPAEEIERLRGETLTRIREMEDSTRAQVDLRAHALLYPPEHAYSRPSIGTPESVAAITREALTAFHQEIYRPAGMLVSLSGAFDADLVRRHVGSWLGATRGAGNRRGGPAPDHPVTARSAATREYISMPHKSQVDLALALPALARRDPDYYALSMANMILGSLGMMGRLGERVRDQQGLAYSVYSHLSARLWAGDWTASASVHPDHVERAIESIMAEMRRLREEPVSDAEIEDARASLIGSLPLRLETNDGMAGFLLNVEYYGLGLDYLERYPALIQSLTKTDLQAAACRYLDPEQVAVVAAGPIGAPP